MENTRKTALLAGATGLVGSYLLTFLLEDEQYDRVVVLSRQALPHTHTKLSVQIVDFEELPQYSTQIQADDIFICLGITLKKAGSLANAYKVEFTYPHQLAQIALQNGAKRLLYVSSIGANTTSKNYYLRTKGEIESALSALPFEAVHLLRPSILYGPRKEVRLGEDLAKVLSMAFEPFIPQKYKGIKAKTVAKYLQLAAHSPLEGVHLHESDRIRRIERRRFDALTAQEQTNYKAHL
jgi:uncharacterized protein YbjT (DUF2867 family)